MNRELNTRKDKFKDKLKYNAIELASNIITVINNKS